MRTSECVTESQSVEQCEEARYALKATPPCNVHEDRNPLYARRDLHDFPYGHGSQPCPFGFNHHSVK